MRELLCFYVTLSYQHYEDESYDLGELHYKPFVLIVIYYFLYITERGALDIVCFGTCLFNVFVES